MTSTNSLSLDSPQKQQDDQVLAKSRIIVKTTRVDGQQVGLRKVEFCAAGRAAYEEFYYTELNCVDLRNAKQELLEQLEQYCKKQHPQGVDLDENMVRFSVVAAKFLVQFDYGQVSHVISLPKQYTDKQLVSFLNLLDFFYDPRFGPRQIAGLVWLKDGSWLERSWFNGAEYWKHHKLIPILEGLENNEQFQTEDIVLTKTFFEK